MLLSDKRPRNEANDQSGHHTPLIVGRYGAFERSTRDAEVPVFAGAVAYSTLIAPVIEAWTPHT